MHQKRHNTPTRIPIKRKGTKYVVRAINNPTESVPVIIAVRDMLKIARTGKEVNELRKEKILKINGRTVIDGKEGVQLFGVLSVGDKNYRLSLLPTNKFFFEETKDATKRVSKIIGKRLVDGGKVQINLYDGTSVIGKSEMKVGDSLYVDNSQKIVKHVSLSAGAEVFIIAGKYTGISGKAKAVDAGKVVITLEDKREVTLPAYNVVAQ